MSGRWSCHRGRNDRNNMKHRACTLLSYHFCRQSWEYFLDDYEISEPCG